VKGLDWEDWGKGVMGKSGQINGAGASGRDLERFHEAAGLAVNKTGSGVARFLPTRIGEIVARAAADHGGDGDAAGALISRRTRILANLQNYYDLECERRGGKRGRLSGRCSRSVWSE